MDAARIKHIFEWVDWDKFTDWENEFLISVEEQFKNKGYLSEKQVEVLERIYKQRQ